MITMWQLGWSGYERDADRYLATINWLNEHSRDQRKEFYVGYYDHHDAKTMKPGGVGG